MTILIDAAKSGNYQLVLDLLRSEGCGSINERDGEMKGTAIFWAANGGHHKIVQLLLNCGANVEIPVKWGMTPLLAAVDRKHYKTTQTLLLSGANVNAQSQKGDTALHIAAYRGSSQLCKLLVAYGTNTQTLNNNGKTAQQEAAGAGHMSLTKLLAPETTHSQKPQVCRTSSLPLADAYKHHEAENGAFWEDPRIPSENDETVPTSTNNRISLRRRILKSAVSSSTEARTERDLTRSHSATELNIPGRMSPPILQGSNQQHISSGQQTSQQQPTGPSGYQQPGSPNRYRPSSPSAYRPQSPSGHQFHSPSGYRSGSPTGHQPQSPSGYGPQSPNSQHLNQQPGSPTGLQQGSPSGYRSGSPTGYHPGISGNHRSESPIGQRSGSPIRYQHGDPGGYQPASPGNQRQESSGGHHSPGSRRYSDPRDQRPSSPFRFQLLGSQSGHLPGNTSVYHGYNPGSTMKPLPGNPVGHLPQATSDLQRNPLAYHSENPLDYFRNGVEKYSRPGLIPNADVEHNWSQPAKQRRDIQMESSRFFHDGRSTSNSHNQKAHKSQKLTSNNKESMDSSKRELFPGIERLLAIIEKLEMDKNNLTKENKGLGQKLQTLQTLVDGFATDTSSEESWQAHQGSGTQQNVPFHQTLVGELDSEKRRRADLEKLCEILVTENCRLRTSVGSPQAMDISPPDDHRTEETGLGTDKDHQRTRLSVLLEDNVDFNKNSPEDVPLESSSTTSSSNLSSVSSLSPDSSQFSEPMSSPESSCQTHQTPGDCSSTARETFAVECWHSLNTSYLRPSSHSGAVNSTAIGSGNHLAGSRKFQIPRTESSHSSSNRFEVPERDSSQSSSKNSQSQGMDISDPSSNKFLAPGTENSQSSSRNFQVKKADRGSSLSNSRSNFQFPVTRPSQSNANEFQLSGTGGGSQTSSKAVLHQNIKTLLQAQGSSPESLLRGQWLEAVALDSRSTVILQEMTEREVLEDHTILATFQSFVNAKPCILKFNYSVSKKVDNRFTSFQVEDELSPHPHLHLPIGRWEKASGRSGHLLQLLLSQLQLDPAGAKQVEVIDCRVYPDYMVSLQQLFDSTRELAPSLSLDQDPREETCILRILLQLLRALDCLRQRGVVVSNGGVMNPSCVYVTEDMRVVIGGLHHTRVPRRENPDRKASEENHLSLRSCQDSFSVAAMLCNLLSGLEPINKLPINPPDWLSHDLHCLLKDMLNANPENRVPVDIASLRAAVLLYGPQAGQITIEGECEQWLTAQAFKLLMNPPPHSNKSQSVASSCCNDAIGRLDWVMCRDFILCVTPQQLWQLYNTRHATDTSNMAT